jgi:hypothetical protein
MGRLVLILAEVGCAEEAIVLHNAIPDDREWGWGGDSPEVALADARRALGDQRYDECARRGEALGWEELMAFIRSTPQLIADRLDAS